MNRREFIPIRTERLLLDKFIKDDWKNLYKIEKSPEQHRYNFETYHPRTESQIKEYVVQLSNQDCDEAKLPFLLAVRLKNNKRLIGFIGFKNGKLAEGGAVEVYYSIYKRQWNKGYGTEALRAMIRFGFKAIGLHRIFAGCDADNAASRRIMEKAGMRFESLWRQDRLRDGEWKDGLGFAILEEDVRKSIDYLDG